MHSGKTFLVLLMSTTACPRISKYLNLIETPASIVRSSHGTLLYSTPDLVGELRADENFLCQLEIADIIDKPFKNNALKNLVKFNPQQLNVVSSRYMDFGVSAASARGLSLDVSGGRRWVTVSDFIHRVQLECPPVVIAMSDEVPYKTSSKRLDKARKRNELWFREMMDHIRPGASNGDVSGVVPMEAPSPSVDFRNAGDVNIHEESSNNGVSKYNPFVFGVILGGLPSNIMSLCTENLIKYGADGICIGGSGMGETAQQRSEAIRVVRGVVGPDRPILLQGVSSPVEILQAISDGVELIASNLPAFMLDMSLVCDWDLELSADASDITDGQQQSAIQPAKRVRITGSEGTLAEVDIVSDLTSVPQPVAESSSSSSWTRLRGLVPLGDDDELDASSRLETGVASEATSRPADEEEGAAVEVEAASVPVRVRAELERDLRRGTRRLRHYSIRDDSLARDARPLMVGCTCHACRNHSRAYVRHLLLCRELLGEILLYHHNAHQLTLLFVTARKRISDNSFTDWFNEVTKEN